MYIENTYAYNLQMHTVFGGCVLLGVLDHKYFLAPSLGKGRCWTELRQLIMLGTVSGVVPNAA